MYEDQVRLKQRVVWTPYESAILQGQGLCYDYDYYTSVTGQAVTDAWGKRDKVVNLPSQTNNNAFAGVAAQAYSAKTGGQWITINEPGSVCQVLSLDASVTIGEMSFLWCLAGDTSAGYFTATPTGFMGKGCARVLQTISAAGLILVELMDGQESGLVERIPTATLTAGGAITCMVGGVTFFDGAATPASDCTFTIASGKYSGQMKRFYQDGNLTTNDVLLTVVAESLDGTTDITAMELDGDTDDTLIVWTGSKWRVLGNVGTTLS